MLRATGLLAPAADLDDIAPVKEKPKKKPEDHPWRKNKWPTKESWRWNKSRQQN
jgi:hypothetical protein